MKPNEFYNVFIASPGDVSTERDLAVKVINEINNTIGIHNGFRVEAIRWETHTFPAIGTDGQDVINRQINDEYDIFVGIMWKRFGTVTKRAESGTVEEFERAYTRIQQGEKVHISLYFNSSSIPQDSDLDQFRKVKEFKNKVRQLGAYSWDYDGTEAFEEIFRTQITKIILGLGSQSKIDKKDSVVSPALFPTIKHSFEKYLDDTGIAFVHTQVDKVGLDSIYTYPDMRDMTSKQQNRTYKVVNLNEVTVTPQGITHMCITGKELSGKTTSLKALFKKYYGLGLYPILLDGSKFTGNLTAETALRIIEQTAKKQYDNFNSIKSIDRTKIVFLVDDFHKAYKSKSKFWHILIGHLVSFSDTIILTGTSLMPVEDINKNDSFAEFIIYELLEFGPKLRHSLVNKWNRLGQDQRYEDPNRTNLNIDSAISQIKTIIGKNYVPAFPFYILTILQALESGKVPDSNYSIHGFYYELLINDNLSKSIKDKKDISLYYNYLTYLAFAFFELQQTEMLVGTFNSFHENYCEQHDLTYSSKLILSTLESANLISIDESIRFKEKYIYYFFVAKYIANNIKQARIKLLISQMSQRVFKDEFASIILFITHLSKDDFILGEMISDANKIFSDVKPARLEDEIKEINALIVSAPKQVLELIDVKSKRQEQVEQEDKKVRMNEEFIDTDDYQEYSLETDTSTVDLYGRLTMATKTIDILGQISKKLWGELDKDMKYKLATTTYELGLRTLSTLLVNLQANKEDIIARIAKMLEERIVQEKHILDANEIKEIAQNITSDYIFRLSFLSTWGTLKNIAGAIGYDRLKNTFKRILDVFQFNSYRLIDLAIKLEYAQLPIDEVTSYKDIMKSNKICEVVLQSLVIDHLYKFEVEYKLKNRLCNILGISMQEQRAIDRLSTIKKN